MESRERRRGRPPSPIEEARSQRLVTFLTPAEFSRLERIAKREDRSLSAVAHRLLVQALKRTD